MTLIVSPAVCSPEDISTPGTIFIAGGISNCPDWQTPTVNRILAEVNDVTVINPRRNGWNMESDDAESTKQIVWEFNHLKMCDTILFWFPKETLCPITLLELGKYLVKPVTLYVGTHPDYQRRLDVTVQTQLERGNVEIFSDLDAMIDELVGDFADFKSTGTLSA